MTVAELIKLLQQMPKPEKTTVEARDPEGDTWAPVTSATYDGGCVEGPIVRLYTDAVSPRMAKATEKG